MRYYPHNMDKGLSDLLDRLGQNKNVKSKGRKKKPKQQINLGREHLESVLKKYSNPNITFNVDIDESKMEQTSKEHVVDEVITEDLVPHVSKLLQPLKKFSKKAREAKEFEFLLAEQPPLRFEEVSVRDAFNKLLLTFSKKKENLSKMKKIRTQMNHLEVRPNLNTIVPFIHAACNTKKFNLLTDIFYWMKDEHLELDGECYTKMISFVSLLKLQEIMKTIKEIFTNNPKTLEVVSFFDNLESFSKDSLSEICQSLKNDKIKLNEYTCYILIHLCAKKETIEECLIVYEYAIEHEIPLTDVEKLIQVIQRTKNQGYIVKFLKSICEQDKITCEENVTIIKRIMSYALDHSFGKNDYETSLELYKISNQLNLQMHGRTLNLIAEGFCKENHFREAQYTTKQMEILGFAVPIKTRSLIEGNKAK